MLLTSEDKILSISEELWGYALEKFELGWINDLISLQDGLHNLAQTYLNKPSICDTVFEYYIQNEKFQLSIELNESETLCIEELKNAVTLNKSLI